MPVQYNWRYCVKCHQMFFDGYSDKGKCPTGGGHAAMGYNFGLPYDVPATSTAQRDWRYCVKCHVMFFDGYSDKGQCPAGGGHAAMGYNFVLLHDIPATSTAQRDWRYCVKCHGMFFDGYSDKGQCPAGGGHAAMGYNFVLPHAAPTPPPPPPSRPRVDTPLEFLPFSPGNFRNLIITASGFKPNERFTLYLTNYINAASNTSMYGEQANAQGSYSGQLGVSCPYGVNSRYEVRLTGELSGDSNVSGVSC